MGMEFGQFTRLRNELVKFQEKETEEFCRECANELALRLLGKIRRRTPVKRGELRRNWMVGSISKKGDVYEIEVINQTSYSSHVEYGHRTRNHKGWVHGKFMLTVSEKEIREAAPDILEKKISAKLMEVFTHAK